MKRYFGFTDRENVFNDFRCEDDGERILLAAYLSEGYEGAAFVLFSKGRKLFEVHGSHCSCNGLEGQWDPEPVTKAQLLALLNNGGSVGCGTDVDEAVRKLCAPKKRRKS